MTWTTPRTYVALEVLTAVILNADIRDNLTALSQHKHGGAAGDGASALLGVTQITFTQQASVSDPGGSLTGFIADTDKKMHFFAGSGSDKTLSTTDHTHVLTEQQQGEQQRIESNRSALEAALDADEGGGNPTSYGTIPSKSHTMTPTAGNSVVISGFNVFWGQDSDSNGTANVTGYVKLTRAGATVKETSNIVSSSSASYLFAGSVQSTFVDSDEPASSTAYGAQFKVARNSGDGSHCAGSGVTAVEVGV